MDVSVVLPTYNRLDRLQRVLDALGQQTVPTDRWEVVVVSDGSTDGTNDWLAAQRPPFALRYVLQENGGVAVARNTGVEHARGALILFIDDDLVPAPNLMAEHLDSHADGGRMVVLGPMLPPPDELFPRSPWVRWEEQMLEKQYQAMLAGLWEPTPRQFYTGNTSLRRREIVDAGGFDPAFRRAEDVELGYRLADRGLRFVFNHNARGLHYAERSFASWRRIPYLYGRYDVVMTRDKGQQWLLPTVMGEYHGRHPFVRGLTQACMGRERRVEGAVTALARVAMWGDRLGLAAVPRYAYSGIFNLLYYQGIRDALGGDEAFWDLIAQHAPDRDDSAGDD